MEEAARRLTALLDKADTLAVDVSCQPASQLFRGHSRSRRPFILTLVAIICGLSWILQLHKPKNPLLTWSRHEKCAAKIPDMLHEWFRPAEDCSMCQDVSQVDRVSNISPEHFESMYAYSGLPVVVEDGTHSWPGRSAFSFQFFKELYNNSRQQVACQFFPYETDFQSLQQVLNMSEDRALMRGGTKPWYIGWSNCDNNAARILKEQYSRPYFLPETSENKNVDWIFMGSPGFGAKMHVDSVTHGSWQAQLKGRKKWILQPPPECIYWCKSLEMVINPGEIIVLDTNRWYHQTTILPGDMSITIGAEYD